MDREQSSPKIPGESSKLPITVVIAARNEAINLPKCLASVRRAQRVLVIDSNSVDETAAISRAHGAEVLQFNYQGGYPKKRQWALNTANITTPWTFLLDADEEIPSSVWGEIADVIFAPNQKTAYLISKGFHFMGKRFHFGGFSHSAILLFRTGKASFEEINVPHPLQDMEVHERLIVSGTIGKFKFPIIHNDYKGLTAYLDRHNAYSSWEAQVRFAYLTKKQIGNNEVPAKLFGNVQERRRFLKLIVLRLPGEPLLWFIYHYVLRLGLLEGRPGLIASCIRANYIFQARAKVHEILLKEQRGNSVSQ